MTSLSSSHTWKTSAGCHAAPINALPDHPIEAAVDIVVVDRETLPQHRDTLGMIDRQALKEGEVAYGRVRV
jgi:hypothetical protein